VREKCLINLDLLDNKKMRLDGELELIIKCLNLITTIDDKIQNLHRFAKDIYTEKFAELESLVNNPWEYANVIIRIQNKSDISKIDFSDFLSNQLIVAINVASSLVKGKVLPKADLDKTVNACETIIQFNVDKQEMLGYVESRLKFKAPNLCEIVGKFFWFIAIGSNCAALLIAACGGLDELAKQPACNIQVLGNHKKNLLGMSKSGQKLYHGYFANLEIVEKAPEKFQTKLVKMLATNCAKAVRIDASRLCPNGDLGKRLLDALLARFDKIQEPHKAQEKKPLAAPDEKPKRRRGGKKFRSLKERTAMTDLRKYQSRIHFDVNNPEMEKGYTGKGFGMLSQAHLGKMKIEKKKNNVRLTKKQQARQMHAVHQGTAGGMVSSIVFAPHQGIELVNPDYIAEMTAPVREQNFLKPEGGFRTVLQERMAKNDLGV
jgi:U4/U6 small nuclear ribonucleoprotein PRP31